MILYKSVISNYVLGIFKGEKRNPKVYKMDCSQTLREENICKISHYLLGGLILSPVVVASCAENEITILHS